MNAQDQKNLVQAEILEHAVLSNIYTLFEMGEYAKLRKVQQALSEIMPAKLEAAE